MRACLSFEDLESGGLAGLIFSGHFLQQISIFYSSFWFVNTLLYKIGFRNSEYFVYNFSVLIEISKLNYFTHFGCSPSLWDKSLKSNPGLSNMSKL